MLNTENDHLLTTQNAVTTTNNVLTTENHTLNSSSSLEDDQHKKIQNKKTSKNLKKDDEIIFGGRFECNKNLLLGSGTFGEIYLGIDTIAKEYVAVKLEKQGIKQPQLRNEKVILDMMFEVEGFPKIFDFGGHFESTYMAMELLGPSTRDLFTYCNYKFSLQTVLLLGIQMIERIQELHSKNYIHRDIKPENFNVGLASKSNTLYLIDFGLAKKYKDTKTMEHITYRETKEIIGTPRYASINNHLGIEQSRRDDLEGIAYVLIYFMKQRLPWQNVEGKTAKEKYKKILEKKLSIPVEILCKDLPIEFEMMISYSRNLRFDERPDYGFLRGIFCDLLFDNYFEEFVFDWAIQGEAKNKRVKEENINLNSNNRNNTDINNISRATKNLIGESKSESESLDSKKNDLKQLGEEFVEKEDNDSNDKESNNSKGLKESKIKVNTQNKGKENQILTDILHIKKTSNSNLINFD